MPFPKKSKKGRPKGSTSTGYSQLTLDDKKEYHHKAVREHRECKDSSETIETESFTPSPSNHPSSSGTASNSKGPQTPRTRKRKKLESQQKIRKRKSVSKKRSNISKSAWQMRLLTADTPQEGSSADTELESTPLDIEASENEGISVDDIDSTSEKHSNMDQAAIHRSTLFRHRSVLVGIFPQSNADKLKMLINLLNKFDDFDVLHAELSKIDLTNHGYLNQRQIRYKVQKLKSKISLSSLNLKPLIQYWIGHLLEDKGMELLFDSASVNLGTEYLPKAYIVSQKANQIAHELVTSRQNVSMDRRRAGVDFVVEVAKQCSLNSQTYRDIQILSEATSCDREFAKKVLDALHSGNISSLYSRSMRFNAIKATHWPGEISKYVLGDERNSRAVPGEEQVSVRYGLRLPKYILLRSRKDIALSFKEKFPDCPYKVSTIMREFPQNAVTPTTRDLQRNACPVHANMRRMVKALNKALPKSVQSLPTSCREIVCLTMCKRDNIDPLKPLTWNSSCVKGECKTCPQKLPLTVPKTLQSVQVSYSQWSTKMKVVKKEKKGKVVSAEKRVFSLYPESSSMSDTIGALEEMCKSVKLHIFTAHMQWHAHDQMRLNLELDSIISIEDYQMNMEVIYSENPTSLSYASNKMTIAMYPICVEFKNQDGSISKGAITFLSDDKDHSNQQVQKFEERMFHIVRDKLQRPISNWARFTDGCGAQFKSGFTAADLFNALDILNLKSASFNFFESHEGKSISDSIGSIVKCAFVRGMMQNQEGVQNIDDILNLINTHVSSSTKKFEFFIVEKFLRFQKRTANSREYCSIPGIMTFHSLKLHSGKIYLRDFTCTDCSFDQLCEECKVLKCVDKSKVQKPNEINFIEFEADVESDSESETPCDDHDDEGQTDASDDSEEEEAEDYRPGDVVWAKHGRVWYPAQICNLGDIPSALQKRFSNTNAKLLVKWFGENNFSAVATTQIDFLGENLVDAARASRSKYIMEQYNIALGLKLAHNV